LSIDDRGGAADRRHLASRLTDAVTALGDPATPMVVVDLDAFDANADDLARRAAGTPLRVASKSLRVPALIARALAHEGFSGVLAYSLREALWLVENGLSDDVVLGYPSVDRGALHRLLSDPRALAAITLMVDDPAQLDLVDKVRASVDGVGVSTGSTTGTDVGVPTGSTTGTDVGVSTGSTTGTDVGVPTGSTTGGGSTAEAVVRVAIDVDAGLRLGRSHVGPKRSPLHDPEEVVAFARQVLDRGGFRLVGVMTYEGQVAGVPDDVPHQRARSLVVRRLKAASMTQLADRRRRIARALGELVELEFWNGGGSGSVEATAADEAVTEVAAGSGLLVPTLFDHYQSFRPRPAAFYGLPVVRRPAEGIATVAGGGFVASGPTGKDRAPTPWAPPGLHLTGLEGAGEVQTPLTGPGVQDLAIGDWVWFRHAKSGELAEHTNLVHLVSGDAVVETVPSYRGLGCAW
jgi:D-serine deaminase-like pyridoxal phosphate-dependent protein